TEIKGDIIPRIIDELPVISVLAAFADGITTIADASELRFKESDRIKAMYDGLKSLGINVSEKADGLEIEGSAPDRMRPAVIDSHCDHRVAMSFLILTDIVPGLSVLKKECVAVSCPTFINDLNSLFCS
ncbi:MAG: 3-phosphoshikimate 1-carboxyvinyltransferase, partial [Lachnospiraceae bacterium]|nr:3-phosphoshikimate 1-carboxyvinyltransferase [Candidatus Darwinimomas equi]